MNDETTRDMANADGRSFEERVFARFDAMDARFNAIDSTLQDLSMRVRVLEEQNERRAVETKPIWERALKEIVETRRELSKRLDRIEAITLENRAGLRDHEDRVEKIEAESTP